MTGSRKKPQLPLAALVLAGAAAAAAEPPNPVNTDVGGSPPPTLDNKTRLLKLLLAKSPAVQRIPQSDNEQAKKLLASAQTLFAQAATAAGSGQIEQAARMLDQALLELVSASRLVPDPAQLLAQERMRYADLHETVRTFLSLYKGTRAQPGFGNATPAAALDADRIQRQLEKAEALANGGHHTDANAVLDDAYKSVVTTLNNMLMAATIVYDQKFASPSEEFQHELARNRSYEELVPLALAQLNTSRESAQLSERYVQQSRELREVAQKQAAGSDFPAALKTIQDATGHLQRSLRVAGVSVPQSQESQP